MGKCEEKTPYVVVCFQECNRMNLLTEEIKRSLKELDLGLKGELTISPKMEELSQIGLTQPSAKASVGL